MSDTIALVYDGLLVAGFGVQHSILATMRTKAAANRLWRIDALAWRSVESLMNVVYILVAAALWQRLPDLVIWQLSQPASTIVWIVCVASWLWYWELHLVEYDCGLAFGSTTLVARLARTRGAGLVPWKVGTRRWIRFPVHTAFFGMFFALPTMTADLLVLAVVLNIYNVIGSVLYDKRLERLAGSPYFEYERRTGLIWPPVYRAPRGAFDLKLPVPAHWRRPAMHIPGVVMGLVLGALYFAVIGHAHVSVSTSLQAAGAGLMGALVVGFVLGRVLKPEADGWDQQQTDLSTTVALAAALGVASWVGAVWLRDGGPPAFAVFLPLWFTVQYLGHVVAFLADRAKWGRTLSEPQPSAGKVAVASNEAREPVAGIAGAGR